jgi:hypothetical protein
VRVWSRLAALHDDEAYRSAAVIKRMPRTRADASRLLAELSRALDDPRRRRCALRLLPLERGVHR